MQAKEPFRYSVQIVSSRFVDIEFAGYMDDGAKSHVAEIDNFLSTAPDAQRLCFSARDLVGFHRDQLRAHVELFLRRSSKIRAIAIVNARPVVHFGAISLALMTKMPVKHFDTKEAARQWLDSLQ